MRPFGREATRQLPSHEGQPVNFGGLWEGVVEDNRDPERIGRVKVRIFDIHTEQDSVEVLPWAEPNFLAAFTHRDDQDRNGGFFHVPPKGSLVNLMFRHGDPNRPVWIGGWHPFDPAIRGRDYYTSKEPRSVLYNQDGVPSCPSWRTARGHKVELDDDVGEVRLTTAGGHKITLSDVEGRRNPEGGNQPNEHGECIKLEDRLGNYIWMHTGSGKLIIRFDGDMEEHYTGDVSRIIEGNLTERVDGKYSLENRGEMHIKTAGNYNLDGATINLNGGLAVPDQPIEVQQGQEEREDPIGQALEDLGDVISRAFTGTPELDGEA